MDIEDYIQDAISLVDSWGLAEDEFSQAVNDQARLMAGQGLEVSNDLPADSPYSSLRF